jgi:4-carboxymuconolactone decarboxylase
MARLPDIDPAALTPEQRRVYDAILSGPRGIVEGPLRVWVNSPGLADKAQALGAFCRYGTSLEQRLSELAILTTGAHWQAGFEWAVHAPIALAAGLDPAAVEAIRTGAEPELPKPDERAVYAFSSELLRHRRGGCGGARPTRRRRSRGHPGLLRPHLDDHQRLRGAAARGRARAVRLRPTGTGLT